MLGSLSFMILQVMPLLMGKPLNGNTKKFEGMTSEEISSMTMEEYEKHERARMEKNAWLVAHDLSNRLDSAPVLSSYIHGLISEKSEDHFFFSKEELKAFHNASTATSKSVPGAA